MSRLGNILTYAGIGLAADLFAPMLTGGAGTAMGLMYGLFRPDADQMDRAYAPDRYGLGRTDNWSVGKLAAAVFGAATILPALSYGLGGFGMPFYTPPIWSTPWSPAGLLPMAWNRGLIQDWGWTAGWLT